MASSTPTPSGTVGEGVAPTSAVAPQLPEISSSPLEMSDLSARQQAESATQEQASISAGEKPTASDQSDNQIEPSATQTSSTEQTRASATRKETEPIGPASDAPLVKADPAAGPSLMITLLLPTGARHPFRIDEKYLKKRNVTVDDMSPLNISVYNMKELIWRDWRDEWEPRPTSPNYIRLIFFGALLDDKAALKDCKFNAETPNVVHMTVKPQEIVEDEDVKQAGKHGRRGSGAEGGRLRCCIIL